MKTFNYLAAAAFMLASSAASATVWAPTNEDTDFFQLDFVPELSTNGGVLAMFDEDDTSFANGLVIGSTGGQVTFAASGSDWTASFIGQPDLTLTGDNNFVLAMDWGLGYFTDTSAVLQPNTNDTYNITFTGVQLNDQDLREEITGHTVAIDVNPIPVPAAAWLFGSGLIGLVGIARRRA